ncbi:uncharacterized protein LOC120662919 [Panicum virgatum]|uniref:Phorbol-ester/DAG-type domain-containing protein n=1 Tax=Panicum virgatum TaxID=38727 RepID=A0A8T0VTF8_PANVG|nr:uncharacterized protein LOC120662919 [Panicum virgatum]KAG2638298.1 hypothetical protein PVAP13_2NG606500 [Panicum virgatum]
MASRHRSHFADPQHPLQETWYRHDDHTVHCNICLLKLAGLTGFGCYQCNIHIHRACAGYFGETMSFFAHPHALKLSRSPERRLCNICRGDCPPGSFAYRCITSGFDAHPLCALLPERVRNPFHPGHELCMVYSESPGGCSACHHPLPKWRYICSSFELHIACAIDPPAAAGKGSNGLAPAAFQGSYDAGAQGSHGGAVGQRSFGGPAGQGWYQYHGPVAPGYNQPIQGYGVQGNYYGSPVTQGGYGPPIQGCYYPAAMPGSYYGGATCSSSGQSNGHNPGSLMTAIAKFLLSIAISTAVSDLASQLLFGS